MNFNTQDKNILIRRIFAHFRDRSEKDKPLYEYESILIGIIKCNTQFSSTDDEIIRNEINEKFYCQLFTKLKHNDQTVYELNSCYQIRRALAEKIITEDDCDTGCKIWENQKKLNASLCHSKKILKLSIDSITDLPLPKAVWNYDSSQFSSNLSFQSAIRIVDRFIHHPIMKKLFVPFSVQTPLYEYKEPTQQLLDVVTKQLEKPPTIVVLTDAAIKRHVGSKAYGMFKCVKNDHNSNTIYLNSKLVEHAEENMTVERTKNLAVLLAIKILHEMVHWLFYHLVGKLHGNMDTPATPTQRAESGNGFEILVTNFIMEHEEDTATFRVNHLIGHSYDFFFNIPNSWRDQLLSNYYWTNQIIDETAFWIHPEICGLRCWVLNNNKSSVFFQLKSCYVSENQAVIDVEPITFVLNTTSSDDDDDDDDRKCRVFHQKNSCKVK
ncbi:unnamed protein product [Rotaria sp. Silwood1]|nr:unnamed protein product [Rotaria sp. Silwood1]CAF1625085.1 unnamed protein product [Rotaria sp. Silwood1]